VANIVGKMVVSGALAATLAAALPSSAVAVYPQSSGPPVYVDPYNAMLGGATMPPSTQTVAVDATFSGPPVYVDPYNVILGGATVPSSAQTVAVDDQYNSDAFAPGYRAPRLWEGPISFDK
jgi:hypothetical protein